MKKRGFFITFEGVEGCGKTTQAKRLAAALRRRGHRVVLTSEPGGTPVSQAIRSLLLHSRHHPVPWAELFLFEAARAQLVEEVIGPALKTGAVVICDRFTDSTVAYQGYGRGMTLAWLNRLNRLATGTVRPDLTMLLEVPLSTGLTRARRKGKDRIEGERMAFHRRVQAGFRRLARQQPRRFLVLPAAGSIEEIHSIIQRTVIRQLSRR